MKEYFSHHFRKAKFLKEQFTYFEDPVRGEIFSTSRLEAQAEHLAESHKLVKDPKRGQNLAQRIYDNSLVLEESYEQIMQAVDEQQAITPAAEWLIDNFHIVRAQLKDISDHLPPEYYRELPKLAEGLHKGLPRVYAIMWYYVSHTDSHFEPEALRRFLLAYQNTHPLTIGELWAVPITLRVVMVENLRRLAVRIVGSQTARKEANRIADEVLGLGEAPARSDEDIMASLEQIDFSVWFSVQLLQRLRFQDSKVDPILNWNDRKLSASHLNADQAAALEHGAQAAANSTVRNIITSCRLISAYNWQDFFEEVSLVDQLLRQNPIYPELDFATRDRYRHVLEHLQRHSPLSQIEISQKLLELTQDSSSQEDARKAELGFYLISKGRKELEKRIAFRPTFRERLARAYTLSALELYLGGLTVATLLLLLIPLYATRASGLSQWQIVTFIILGGIVASEVGVSIINRLTIALLGPTHLPRLDLDEGIPAEGKTFVVVPTFLTSHRGIDEQLEQLEIHYLANSAGYLHYAILSDWADAASENTQTDMPLLEYATKGLKKLNEKYGPVPGSGTRFFIFHRRRLYNESEDKWIAWERKRGKLCEFNRMLLGETDTTFIPLPNYSQQIPKDIRYVITLDADTRLPKGCVAQLVGTMMHPLNEARYDSEKQRVTEGYGILQPRITPTLPGLHEGSLFQVFSSGPSGVDPYASAVSDVYQDLFDEGSFTGKGIYNLRAFEQSLRGRIPENSLLSHDLFEGCYARAGFLSDVEFFEEFPTHTMVSALRSHRWVRGDWQLLPWILGRGSSSISALGRWKMIDNLRRSLVAPAIFFLVVFALTSFLSVAWVWASFALGSLLIPCLITFVADIWSKKRSVHFKEHLQFSIEDLGKGAQRAILQLLLLPYHAWMNLDAICRTLYRLTISHKHLLEWTTAAQVKSNADLSLRSFFIGMRGGLILTFAAVVVVASTNPLEMALATFLFFIWLLSPFYAQAVSRPFVKEEQNPISSAAREHLHLAARQIWHFFATFVQAEDHYLPPDNFQEEPQPVVAHRSSPTNFGLYLLSVISAKKFGWIGLSDAVHRLDRTLESLERLPKHHGHFYNWYETTSLRPLDPKYISSVDNGNLAGHLIATARGLEEMLTHPMTTSSLTLGPLESIRLFKQALRKELQAKDLNLAEKNLFARAQNLEHSLLQATEKNLNDFTWRDLKAQASQLHQEALQLYPTPNHQEITGWALNIHGDIINLAGDYHSLLAWTEFSIKPVPGSNEMQKSWKEIQKDLTTTMSLEKIASHGGKILEDLGHFKILYSPLPSETAEAVDQLTECLKSSIHAAQGLSGKIKHAQKICYSLFKNMNFGILYDKNRKLFSIGLRVFENVLDVSYYDLLASESRLLSFIAIAKGDVPVSHWFCLGRSLAQVEKGSALISWSGSMFEYLMPSLVMNTPEGSLIKNTCDLVIQRQVSYGHEKGVPWGISESAYNKRDLHMTYQYSNFGIPDLALKRGLGSNLVVAPYATLLAAMYDPAQAATNLQRLKTIGANGHYGFYEAIDYTSSRLPVGQPYSVIKAYMAHHQGMSLVSLTNFFFDNYMCRLFHAEPLVQATEILLQERTPRAVGVIPAAGDHNRVIVREEVAAVSRRYHSVDRPTPRTQLLSNGNYSVMLTSAGSGFSRFQNLAVTRWREDVTQDHWGSYIFIKDRDKNLTWSATYQPLGKAVESYEVTFAEDRVLFEREDEEIRSKLEIFISPESSAEIRHLTLTNESDAPRELEITSYAEIVMNTPAADIAHPAFSNLFMETEFIPEHQALIARRRPRSAKETELWTSQILSLQNPTNFEIEYETDRMKFLGRGRDIRHARAINTNEKLTRSVGAVLDPIFSLRTRVHLEPGATTTIQFTTAVATSRDEILRLAESYHEAGSYERVSSLAWAQAQVKMHYLNIEPDEAHLYQRLASRLFYLDSSLRPASSIIKHNKRDLTQLWAQGISGDFPIILVRVEENEDRVIVRQLLKAQEYFAMKRLTVDLVIMNGKEHSYGQELQQMLEAMVHMSPPPAELPQSRGKVFIIREDLLTREDRLVIYTEARVALFASQGSLSDQVNRMLHTLPPPAAGVEIQCHEKAPPLETPELEYFNGVGGFTPDGREYVIALKNENDATPAPWINVISNGKFGFQVSESGSGYTWSMNSRENQITPWSNDPVCDPCGECFYIFDLDSRCLWSPTALPIRVKEATYIARHGQGYSRFEHLSHGIHSTLTQFVPMDQPVKISEIRLENRSNQWRRLSVYSYVEWLLGFSRATMAPTTVTEFDSDTGAMFAFNARHNEYGTRIAFAGFLNHKQTMTGDRREFIGRNSSLRRPLGILRSEQLSNRTGAAFDPCGAFQTDIVIGPGEAVKLPFILGQAESREEAHGIILELRNQFTENMLASVIAQWNEWLDKVQVETPDKSFDLLLNRWLLYQNISCRYWARSGFYQAGGAFGFRDQLQDVMALTISMPETARKHILRASSRQFLEGDVQHWWHPPLGRGVRTHFSDDLLWLPFVTFNYLQVTKDFSILDQETNFLEGPLLTQEQEDSYFTPTTSQESASLFEHCARALDRSLKVGVHGLPLMGCGDWNDGMNRVGKDGKGESVWLGWFLHQNLIQFSAIADARDEKLRAQNWRNHAAHLKSALEDKGWDGDWYRRAFYDDGTPLGSRQSVECQIDSLTQTWAVISEAADPSRARHAMQAIEKYLVNNEARIIQLFTPPFDKTDHDPGYIKGYLPGVRENGGQYTHAAAWVIIAHAMLGNGAKAHEMFQLVNPILHGDSPEHTAHYKIEPYVVAGDVYSQKQHPGRGGWSWYTGSAGWLYRAGLEYMLGLRLRGEELSIDPCIPPDWKDFRIRYRHKSATYDILVENPAGVSQGVQKIEIDGKVIAGDQFIPLIDDGKTHSVQILLGAETQPERESPLSQ
ncbi:MAG: hypothetical protein JSU04_08325 [Bdellovibrionales bacterium]|nr:hypothetical protein [Bdellovibrionales bacterium]